MSRASVYAMDTYFYHSQGAYSFESRCEMLRILGYDSTYLTLWSEAAWKDVDKLSTVRDRYDLGVEAVYVSMDITKAANDKNNARVLDLIRGLKDCGRVELNLSAGGGNIPRSDPSMDSLAIEWLQRLLDAAEPNGTPLSLYPHISCWLERTSDAVRLCRQLPSRLLGITFPSYHWYAIEGDRLKDTITEAAPYLHSVNLCGSRKVNGYSTIEPIYEGELDLFYMLHCLKTAGFQGSVGLQGYSVGGDVYDKLERSLATFRMLEHRLERYPHWGELRAPL